MYDTVKYGRNTAHMKRIKYGPFMVINDSIRNEFQRIRSPYLSTWDDRKRPVFDPFHMGRITAVFYPVVHG